MQVMHARLAEIPVGLYPQVVHSKCAIIGSAWALEIYQGETRYEYICNNGSVSK